MASTAPARTPGQVAAELFKTMAGVSTTYVPYKANTQALTSLLQGEVDFISYDATWASTQAEPKGRLRILAVTSSKRSGTLPSVPTLAELGMKDFDITPWWGVVVPAGTPRPVIDKLAGWFNQINAAEDTKTFLANYALDAFPGTPESMAALLRNGHGALGRVREAREDRAAVIRTLTPNYFLRI
jgi:tripartite-type tricarboxylate transporter receptor subunit TctC